MSSTCNSKPANLGAERQAMGAVGLGLEMHAVQDSVTILNPSSLDEKVVLHCLRGNQRLEIEVRLMKLAPANDPSMSRLKRRPKCF